MTTQIEINSALLDLIDGLYAYNNGMWDSGIEDKEKEHKLQVFLASLSNNEKELVCDKYIETYLLSEEDIEMFRDWYTDFCGAI